MIDPDWGKDYFVIWPQYRGVTTLSECERWFYYGVDHGTTYGIDDEVRFVERQDMFHAWEREYNNCLSQIVEPRWIPERTNRTSGPKGKLP